MNELEDAALIQVKAGVATQGVDPDTYEWESRQLPGDQGVFVRCWRVDEATDTMLMNAGIMPLDAIAVDKKGTS